MAIKIKALNADNEIEVDQLRDLYKIAYGERFKLARVDQASFWMARSGRRFSTIIVQQENKVVAAVSLRADRENSKHIQLYMPVIHPALVKNSREIIYSMVDLIQKISLRQAWELAYVYQYLQIAEQAEFASLLLQGHETAYWPSSMPLTKFTDGLGPVVLSTRILSIPSNQNISKSTLFAPDHHHDFCQNIYKSLGLKTRFKDNKGENVSTDLENAYSADRRAFERRVHHQAGFSLSFVEPSLVNNFNSIIRHLEDTACNADYIALNLFDPKTPEFSVKLESLGFKVCGALPFLRNRHTLLYYKTSSKSALNQISKRSFLLDYLKADTSSDSSENSIHASGNSKSRRSPVAV